MKRLSALFIGLACLGCLSALELSLPVGRNQFEVVYSSVLSLETPYNPNYTYLQERKEYLSLTFINEKDEFYEVTLQTERFVSNISEYQQEQRFFDSDYHYDENQKLEDPIFSTIVSLVMDKKGLVISRGELPPDYTTSIALHFVLMLYDVTKQASNLDILNNNRAVIPKKWEIELPMPREKGYHEIFDAILKPRKRKKGEKAEKAEKAEKEDKEDGKPLTQTVDLLKGRIQDTDFDETINDAKLKGWFKFDVESGMITKFKLDSRRDVDDPKMGFHSLKEDMILTLTPKILGEAIENEVEEDVDDVENVEDVEQTEDTQAEEGEAKAEL